MWESCESGGLSRCYPTSSFHVPIFGIQTSCAHVTLETFSLCKFSLAADNSIKLKSQLVHLWIVLTFDETKYHAGQLLTQTYIYGIHTNKFENNICIFYAFALLRCRRRCYGSQEIAAHFNGS